MQEPRDLVHEAVGGREVVVVEEAIVTARKQGPIL